MENIYTDVNWTRIKWAKRNHIKEVKRQLGSQIEVGCEKKGVIDSTQTATYLINIMYLISLNSVTKTEPILCNITPIK